MNFFPPKNTNQWSPNQLQVSRSYFAPPSPTGGNNPASAFQSASAGGYGSAALNPWQGGLPSSVMQGGTYAWGQQGGYTQPNATAAYFISPQQGGYMPINTIPGLASYPGAYGAYSVRPQGPSYGYAGGDQFVLGGYNRGYDITGMYDSPEPSYGPFNGGTLVSSRRSNPFNSPGTASRYFVSPDELQNGFDFGLSSILNTKPTTRPGTGAGSLGQFKDDLRYLANDDLFKQFLDADTIAQIDGLNKPTSSGSSSLDDMLAAFLGQGADTASTATSSNDSLDIDSLFASVLGGAAPTNTDTDDPVLAAALIDFNEALEASSTPAPTPSSETTEVAAAPPPPPPSGFSTL